jgi:membrane protease YdiL (CAAX protease family)
MAVVVGGGGSLLGGLVYAGGGILYHIPSDEIISSAPGHVHLIALSLMAVASVALYYGLVRVGENRRPSEIAFRPAALEVLAGLLIGAAMMAVTVGLMVSAGWITLTPTPVRTVTRALGLSIQSGVMEEVVFRLVVLRLLWRAFGVWPALILSACLFGGLHIMNPNSSWFAAVCIMVEAGIMLALFYIVTGRVWVAVGVHAGWNFTQGWLWGAPVSGTSFFEGGPLALRPAQGVPAWLSGADFGPEASLAGLLVGTSIGAFLLWLSWKRGLLQAGEAPAITATAPDPALPHDDG